LGQRRWQIGGHCDAATPLLPHDDLRLLAEFTPTDEWVLESGDMLYVPPGVAHNGVAVGDDCMTYSIGFRAPSRSELIAHYADHLLAELAEDDRYADPGLAAQANPGEIAAADIAKIQAMIAEKMLDRAAFARWFGAFNSTPKYADQDFSPEADASADEVISNIEQGAALIRNPASRFSFIRSDGGAITLFVDGEAFDVSGAETQFAEALCASPRMTVTRTLAQELAPLITTLINQGSVQFDA
jgi:50S ribosomal protein L16 3-hydroxylase